jgi:AcrR family transcriptional regulator
MTKKPKRGLTRLQHDQRATNRQNLLAAAQKIFLKKTYSATTVDDIAQLAKVSRITFYRHFKTKSAVVKALTGNVIEQARELYTALADQPDPNQAAIEVWIERCIAYFRSHRSTMAFLGEALINDPDIRLMMQEEREKLLVSLAERMPAFAIAFTDTPLGRQIKLRAVLLFIQFDAFLSVLVLHDYPLDRGQAIPVMARLIREYLQDAGADAAAMQLRVPAQAAPRRAAG